VLADRGAHEVIYANRCLSVVVQPHPHVTGVEEKRARHDEFEGCVGTTGVG
jgi:hypothetical protein